MKGFEVYFLDDSELADFEAIQKGYRLDVYVNLYGNYYNVRIYDITRLKQDFEEEEQCEGYFAIEPNLVIVKEVNKKNIIFTLQNLYMQEYFKEIKPVENIEINALKKIN